MNMYPKNLIVCALWTVLISRVAANHSESLDLIDDCCGYKCGRIEDPLIINSDGLDKKDDQFSDLKITSTGQVLKLVDPNESYCLITIYTLDYAMLNLTYYVDSSQDENTVVIMDSSRVNPKQSTTDSIDDGQKQEETGKPKTFRFSRRYGGPNIEMLRIKVAAPSGHLNKYELQNYRIMPGRLLTIGVKIDALHLKKVRNFDASIVADQGTAGRTFFITLGVVVVFFVIGVPGSFLVYKRYFKKSSASRSLERRHIVHFETNAGAAHYRTEDRDSPRYVQQEVSRTSQAVAAIQQSQRRRVSLTERILKATSRKADIYVPAVLPKHELLEKQEQILGAQKPVSVVSPIQKTVAYAFPGIDPGNEGDGPPQTLERTLQSSRSRVVSHQIISEEDLYDNAVTPTVVQDSINHR